MWQVALHPLQVKIAAAAAAAAAAAVEKNGGRSLLG